MQQLRCNGLAWHWSSADIEAWQDLRVLWLGHVEEGRRLGKWRRAATVLHLLGCTCRLVPDGVVELRLSPVLRTDATPPCITPNGTQIPWRREPQPCR